MQPCSATTAFIAGMKRRQTAKKFITHNHNMYDIEVILENKPGTLAQLGEILGRNKISLEGGGVFGNGEKAIAHFLVEEGERAKETLEKEGIGPVRVNPVLLQKLRQDVPGQLGMFCRQMADEGVNILVQYSDHANELVVVVDDHEKGKLVSEKWKKSF